MIEVRAQNTTIVCSRCGNKVPKSLAARIHRCEKCGLVMDRVVMDRDYNASLNILHSGLQSLGVQLPTERGEVTPVEILMGSRKQEQNKEAIGLVR